MLRTEGVYTYLCSECSSLTAITARLTMPADKKSVVICPICNSVAELHGEGHIQYQSYSNTKKDEKLETKEPIKAKKEQLKPQELPEVLTADDVAACLGISKQGAYELFRHTDFPSVKVGRLVRVYREEFEKWLTQNK